MIATIAAIIARLNISSERLSEEITASPKASIPEQIAPTNWAVRLTEGSGENNWLVLLDFIRLHHFAEIA